MIRKDTSGFGHVGLILAVLVIAVLGGVGWYVYDRNNQDGVANFEECVAAGNPVMESYPEQCAANGQVFTKELNSAVSLDSEKLPEGWNKLETGNSNQVMADYNSGMGNDENQPSCQFEALLTPVDNETTNADTLRSDAEAAARDMKGLRTERLGSLEHKLRLNGMDQTFTFQRYNLNHETDGTQVQAIDTYIVGKQDYGRISLSCTNGEPTVLQPLLAALDISVY